MTMDVDYAAIGKRIKFIRKKNELTQAGLAEKVGLSVPHIANIEVGTTKLSLLSLVKIANALAVSVDELLCDSIIKSKDVIENQIQELCKDCDEREIKMVYDMIVAFKAVIRKKYLPQK